MARDAAARRIAQDLFVLEVNLIVSESISARPITNLAHCLLDLAERYERKLELIEPKVGLPVGAPTTEDTPLYARLEALRARARDVHKRLRDAPEQGLPPADHTALERIRGGCDELKGVLERLQGPPEPGLFGGPPALPDSTGPWAPHTELQLRRTAAQDADTVLRSRMGPTDSGVVRKLRDLMFEEVLAQTRIHLAGDVHTRVSPEMLNGERGAQLMALHDQSVKQTLNFWGQMVGVVRSLFEVLFK